MESETKLEKASRQQSQYKVININEFRKASEEMWNTHVRSDLILNKNLLLCKTCLAFFYQSDSQADHPKEHVLQVQKYCEDNGITSNIILEQVLLKESKSICRFNGKDPFLPSFNPIHKKELKEETGILGQKELKWLQERVFSLEKELDKVLKENKMVKDHVDIMIAKYLQEKMKRQEEGTKVELLIESLSGIYARDQIQTKIIEQN